MSTSTVTSPAVLVSSGELPCCAGFGSIVQAAPTNATNPLAAEAFSIIHGFLQDGGFVAASMCTRQRRSLLAAMAACDARSGAGLPAGRADRLHRGSVAEGALPAQVDALVQGRGGRGCMSSGYV